MKIHNKKNQKPIELDVHFKYRCYNCSLDHWLSYNQVRTKNYKIVCDCGAVSRPKRINKIKILYTSVKKERQSAGSSLLHQQAITAPTELINKCSSVLTNYGFTKEESSELLTKAYKKQPTEDHKVLIKIALSLIGVNHD